MRPVLITKVFGAMYFVIPMTSHGKDNIFHHTLPFEYFNKNSRLILSQARFIDKRRLRNKILRIPTSELKIIQEKLRTIMF